MMSDSKGGWSWVRLIEDGWVDKIVTDRGVDAYALVWESMKRYDRVVDVWSE